MCFTWATDYSPIHSDVLGKVGLNLALGLVTSCCSCQGACLAPVRAIRVGVGFYKKKIPLHIVERCEVAARQSHKRFRRCNIKLIILFACFIAGQSIRGRPASAMIKFVSTQNTHVFFKKKNGSTPAFFHLFLSFQTHITIFQQINLKKCPSSIQCQDSNSRPLEHESPPITTGTSCWP